MTLATDYGRMDKPERRPGSIGATSNPVAVIEAAYAQWLPLARAHENELLSGPEAARNVYDRLYQEAEALLQPNVTQLAGISPYDLEAAILRSTDSESLGSGLFSSALINMAGVSKVEHTFQRSIAGYRLPPGKTIVIGERSEVRWLGYGAEGNILNLGTADRIGPIYGGVLLNAGETTAILALHDVTIVNTGNVSGNILLGGSTVVNFGNVEEINFVSGRRSFIFNFGTAGNITGTVSDEFGSRFDSVSVNAGKYGGKWRSDSGYIDLTGGSAISNYAALHGMRAGEAYARLHLGRLHELAEGLGKLRNGGFGRQALENAISHNWKGFEDNVMFMAKTIRGMME